MKIDFLKNWLTWYRIVPPLLSSGLLYLVVQLQDFYVRNCMSRVTGLEPATECADSFLDYLYLPLISVYAELLVLFFILFLLPSRLLRNWFLYIGSWAVPVSVWFVSTTKVTPNVITWVTSPTDAALLSVNALTWLTLAYAVVHLTIHVWRSKQSPAE